MRDLLWHSFFSLYLLVNDDDNESFSSDESLSIEFPPPPSEFSSSSTPDKPCPSEVQTTIIRSDSGITNTHTRTHTHTHISHQFLFSSIDHHYLKKFRKFSFICMCFFCGDCN